MSVAAYRQAGLAAGFADGCDRLVDPAVTGPARAMQRRFLAVMLAAPFALGAFWPAVATAFSTDIALAVLGLAFCAAWSAIVWVAARATLAPAASAALALAVLPLGVVIASVGGFSSPALLLALALPVEAWWVSRNRAALRGGLLAAAVVVVAQFPVGVLPLPQTGFAAWQWLLPLAYALLIWARMPDIWRRDDIETPNAGSTELGDIIDCAVLTLADNGDVSDATGATVELIGVQPEMLAGAAFFERIHVGDRVGYLTALADARDGLATGQVPIRLRVAGEQASYRSFVVRFRTSGGLFAIVRDDEERAERMEQARAQRDLVEGSEIAKTRFLATVSHELRTPLNAIIGFADMLALEMVGPLNDPRQKSYAGLIRDSGSHLLGVVNAILDASKIEAGAYAIHPEPFVFAEAAAACHGMLSLQAEAKSLVFQNGVKASVGEIDCDRRAVQQILINLLSNAIKFTPDGGTVRLDARRSGRSLVVEVSDTGIGIGAEDLARVCKPFAQVQNDYTRQFEGAGLGLSIAKGLVALHGGSMSIESAEGEGTIVTVVLPVDGPASAGARHEGTRRTEEGHAQIRRSA